MLKVSEQGQRVHSDVDLCKNWGRQCVRTISADTLASLESVHTKYLCVTQLLREQVARAEQSTWRDFVCSVREAPSSSVVVKNLHVLGRTCLYRLYAHVCEL